MLLYPVLSLSDQIYFVLLSSALKRFSVSEVVVHRCSLLWQLWVHIAAELLVPQDLPANLAIASGSGIAAAVIDGAGGAEGAKNAFMSLLAPKNGVGKPNNALFN